VITLVSLICLWILFFMLAQNMLRLIIILSEIELQRRRFRFILFPLTINLQMSSKPLLTASFTAFRFKLWVDPPPSAWGGILMHLYRKYCRHTI
jgi:hypothetical protein